MRAAQNHLLVPVVAGGVALIALMWFTTIGPKRSDRARVNESVSSHQERLETARDQLAGYTASRKRFPGMLVELRRLDIAVPARGDISGLLRQVQRRASLRNSDLRLASLKTSGAAATTDQPTTPGATPGPGGLSALPFTFSYTGHYFDLLKVLRAVRQAVTVRSGNLSIDGRLLTIDGVSFRRPDPASKLTKVVLNATAYISADTAKPPAPADAATKDATPKAGS